jgi:hypothetical protein
VQTGHSRLRLRSDIVRTYSCYIHRHSSMTPQRRMLICESQEILIEDIRGLIGDWPQHDVVEIYDETDRLVLRFKGKKRVHAH